MPEDNLEVVYQAVEKAFIRMQANEVLTRCMDSASLHPLQNLVESLILAGPESLDVFREILAETTSRKSQLEDDLSQVMCGLQTNLEGYGVRLGCLGKPVRVARIKPNRFLGLLRSQGVAESETQKACLQLFQDAREIVLSLSANYSLLSDVEGYLQDWMWGVFYRSIREETVL